MALAGELSGAYERAKTQYRIEYASGLRDAAEVKVAGRPARGGPDQDLAAPGHELIELSALSRPSGRSPSGPRAANGRSVLTSTSGAQELLRTV
jgi:hypothetical protein